MLYSSIFLKLIFCQKKSSVVNFRKVKSIYKSKHKHGAMKTRRMWGPAGSQSAEVTVGAGLAGKRVGTSFPFLNTGQRGDVFGEDMKPKGLCHLCSAIPHHIPSPEGNGLCMCTFAVCCWALGRIDERLGTGKGQIVKSSRVGEIAGWAAWLPWGHC